MKIAIFTDSFYPYVSGVTTAISNRAEGLIERGHEVAVFRPKTSSSFPKSEENLKIYDLPISLPNPTIEGLNIEIPLFIPAYRAVREFQPDIFHVDTQWGVGWQGVFCAKLFKKPLISTFHTFWSDSEYLKYFPFSNVKRKKRLMWKYMLFFHNRFEVVCCPSQLVEEKLIEKGLETETVVVPNCIKEIELKSEEFVKERRREYGLNGAPNFVFVGRVSHEKSLGKVIRAYHQVVSNFPGSKLAIIGNGDAREELEEMTEKMGLDEKVKFLGKVPNKELTEKNLFRLGDVFVTASKTENHPVSLLEAQSLGLPIVAPSAEGVPEIVTDQEDGFLYSSEADDEIEELASLLEKSIEDEELREKMSKAALENSKRHTAKKVSEELEKLYEERIDEKV